MTFETADAVPALVGGVLILLSAGFGLVFLRTLQVALQRCAPENRTVSPGKVWLSLIPIFNVVWQFMLVSHVAESLRREFAARQITPKSPQDDFGKSLGYAVCCLGLASVIPLVGILTGLASFICWIIYWVKISGYSQLLNSANLSSAGDYPIQASPDPGTAWRILLILMFGFCASGLQRVTLSLVGASVQHDLHFSTIEMSWIFSGFGFGLIVGIILMTIITALCGTRWGIFVSLLGASLAASATSLPSSLTGLIIVRILLGFFAGGLLPAGVQTVREWFPSRLRPFAIGLILAVGQLASVLAPILSGQASEWRRLLLISGAPTAIAAVLCLVVWPSSTPREPFRGVSGTSVLLAAMLALGVILITPISQFVSTWVPLESRARFGITIADMRLAAIVLPAAALLGAIMAGGIAWVMISGGIGSFRTRAVLLTIFGAMLSLVALNHYIIQWRFLLILIAVCSMAVQGWLTLLYAAVADVVPARGVAIAAAIGTLFGAMSGMLTPIVFSQVSSTFGTALIAEGVSAIAAVALLIVVLPMWLIRAEPSGLTSSTV